MSIQDIYLLVRSDITVIFILISVFVLIPFKGEGDHMLNWFSFDFAQRILACRFTIRNLLIVDL